MEKKYLIEQLQKAVDSHTEEMYKNTINTFTQEKEQLQNRLAQYEKEISKIEYNRCNASNKIVDILFLIVWALVVILIYIRKEWTSTTALATMFTGVYILKNCSTQLLLQMKMARFKHEVIICKSQLTDLDIGLIILEGQLGILEYKNRWEIMYNLFTYIQEKDPSCWEMIKQHMNTTGNHFSLKEE